MRRTMAAIFDTQTQAQDAMRAIQQLGEDTVRVQQAAIVSKDDQGVVSVLEIAEPGVSWDVPGGALVGSAVGMLAGPVGVAAGILLGGLVGRVFDVAAREQTEDFRTVAGDVLNSGQAAIVAEIDEESTGPVDAAVLRHGGRIKRIDLSP